jgi:mono/diheme cytochrome c family protein
MRPRRAQILLILFLSAVVTFAITALFDARLVAQDAPALPPGPSSQLVASRCLTCHGADLIRQQRLSRPGWIRELDKMIRWGASMTEAERDAAADYLAASLPLVETGTPARNADGRGVFERRCLSCHGVDIVEQQRLARPGWVREVDKMIRWGATVAENESETLIDYLTSTYRPRNLR